MIKYSLGLLINLFNPGVSIFSKIDTRSKISREARLQAGVKAYVSELGDYSYVGNHTDLVYAQIGKFCSIAGHCHIGMGTHTLNKLSISPIFTERTNGTVASWTKETTEMPFSPVMIGNDVWIESRRKSQVFFFSFGLYFTSAGWSFSSGKYGIWGSVYNI